VPDEPNAPTPDPTSDVRLLHCLCCGLTLECRPVDLTRFTRTAWPKRCGAAMPLFGPVEKPTPPERPGLD
jgi:hypothetical protein